MLILSETPKVRYPARRKTSGRVVTFSGMRLSLMLGLLLIIFIRAMKPMTTPCWKGYRLVKIEAVAGAVQEEAA